MYYQTLNRMSLSLRNYVILLLILTCVQCKKEWLLPVVVTAPVTELTAYSATSGGEIVSDGNAKVIESGICWSWEHIPNSSDEKCIAEAVEGNFSCRMTGLRSFTRYYVRAYASTQHGTAYGEPLSFVTDYDGEIITDIDGNKYHTVTIGTQTWMLENLRVTRFRNGDSIPLVEDSLSWGDWHPRRCIYANDTQNLAKYGFLYNQAAVRDTSGLAPNGWHIPSDQEYQILIDYLGGEYVAGGKLKQMGFVDWMEPNAEAGNESGFTALPGGYRRELGWFEGKRTTAAFWTSLFWCSFRLFHNNGQAWLVSDSPGIGASVRCIKDE